MENNEAPREKKKYQTRGPAFIDNRKWQKLAPVKDGWRVQCSHTEEGQRCNGRGRLLNSGKFIQKPKEAHSSWCKPVEDIQEWEEMKANYKLDVAYSILKPRAVFSRHMSQLQQKSGKVRSVPYPSMKNMTTYAKKKVNPRQPKDLEEMAEFLAQEHYKSMLDYKWQGSARLQIETVTAVDDDLQSAVSIVFADKQWTNHVLGFVEDTVDVFSDGTFRITPSKLKTMQLFKLEVACFNKGTPIAYALMERRKAVDYESVISCIVEKFAPQLRQCPVKVHLDFESGERKGWEMVLPQAIFVPCVFHFDQIQWRNARYRQALRTKRRLKKAKLSEAEKVEKEEENKLLNEIRRALKFIMGMPVLPLQMKADKKLLKRIIGGLSEKAKERLERYMAYFERNWLSKKNPPESWNVSEEPYKTNNFSETGNRLMNAFFPHPHPQPWSFVRGLVSYHNSIANEFGTTVGRSDLRKGDKIKNLTKLLLDGHIDRLQFLAKIVDETFPHFEERFQEEIVLQSKEKEEQEEDNGRGDEDTDDEHSNEEYFEEEYLDQEFLDEEYLEDEYFNEEYLRGEYEEEGEVSENKQNYGSREDRVEGNFVQMEGKKRSRK